jgi:serine/threonine protein kinase
MADYDHLCFGCMKDKGFESMCPHCGWEVDSPIEAPQHLPPGTILQEKYLLGRVLGHGGFGITYLAYDINLDTKLAIKEYMPRDFATRATEQTIVSVFSGEFTSHFENGLMNFLDEAKTLAQFNNHPGIVGVRDFFKENGTAYLVMYYLEGIDFKQYLETQGGKIPYQTALMIMIPVMDALREVHSRGTLHRDISPDNIYITSEGQVKILDFGAARYAMTAFSKSISVILKPGFAPEEQYRSKGNQGPWTDVYSTAATFYRAIVGYVPPESLDRLEEDTIQSPSSLGIDIPDRAEAALMKALSIRAADRYQSIAEFQQDLFNDQNLSDLPISNIVKNDKKAAIPEKKPANPPKKKTISKWIWIGGGAAIAILLLISIVGSLFLFKSLAENKSEKPAENTTRIENNQKDEEKEQEIAEETLKELTVPNLVNQYEEDAKKLLQNEGLILGEITYVESLYVKKGIVTTQSLTADQEANENDVINLEVSKGIELPLDEETIKKQHLKLVYEYWDKGYELNKQKDYFNALKHYIQARDMAEIIYNMDGNFDAQYSVGVLERNISLAKRSLGYFEFALIDIENSVVVLEDLLTKDPLFQNDHIELANSYADLSFIQFLNQMPKEAVTSAEKAIELNPNTLIYKVNLAHAYLFSDQFDAAVTIYSKHLSEKVNEQTFKEVVLGDFNYFRKFNITHPDMEKIETIYANADEAYSDEEEIQKTIHANGTAIEQEDVAGYMSTIDPNSGSYPVTEKGIKDLFNAYDNFKLVIESIEVLENNANTARVKVSQVLSYSDGSQTYQSKSIMIHTLVQGGGTYKWLIATTETEGS